MSTIGKTTQQMQKAKPNSIYIWPDNNLNCAKQIASRASRQDLIIKSPSYLTNKINFAGRKLGDIDVVIDHACYELNTLTTQHYDTLDYIVNKVQQEKISGSKWYRLFYNVKHLVRKIKTYFYTLFIKG